ncbi:cupin domain-containing protein [Frankia sp. AvcI1]|uniref:cupin domain-containing protein n=1 Tax=Frankia sp. AvcI1 TaxID=573496 RepID=UPI0028C41F6C|nr:cupin domain-containing protein [Frankia sp. AvcI1]
MKASRDSTGGSLSFLEASIPPGSGPPPHIHTLEDEAFYILSGSLEFRSGGQSRQVGTGDFIHVPRGVGHSFRNNGVHAVRMVFLYTPGGFENFFVEAGEPAEPGRPIPRWGPEDYPRAVEIATRYGWQPSLEEDEG